MNGHIINKAIMAKEIILINNRYIGKIFSKVLNGKGIIVKLLFDNDYIDKIIVQYNLLPPLQQKGYMLITKDDTVTNIDYNSFKKVLREYIKKVNIASICSEINNMVGGRAFMTQEPYGQEPPLQEPYIPHEQGQYGQSLPQEPPLQEPYIPHEQGQYGQSPLQEPSQEKLVGYSEDSKKYTDFVQFDKNYAKFLGDIFRIEEDVFERLFPKDLSPNEAIEKRVSISGTVLDKSALDQLKGVFTTALQTYQKPDIDKDFDDYRYRLAMTQFVLTDKDFELLGEGIANAIRKRLIKLQKTMTFATGSNISIYPSINLFSFLIYVKNNNGYCEFKNKYVGRMEKQRLTDGFGDGGRDGGGDGGRDGDGGGDGGRDGDGDGSRDSRIKSIKEQIIALRFNPNSDPDELKRLEKELRGIKKEDYVFEKVIGPGAIPNGNTLVSPYEQLPYESLYSILLNPTASADTKRQALELLAQDYVICLQPHPSYVIWCFQRLLLAWYSNEELTKGIHKVCILINFKRAEPGNAVNADYGIMPVILIVPKYGNGGSSSRDIAFTILRILNDCFFSYNDVAWSGSYPKYFKSISPLIWYAHGDGVYNALKQRSVRYNQNVPLPRNADIEPVFPKDVTTNPSVETGPEAMGMGVNAGSMGPMNTGVNVGSMGPMNTGVNAGSMGPMNTGTGAMDVYAGPMNTGIGAMGLGGGGGHYKYYLKKVNSKL